MHLFILDATAKIRNKKKIHNFCVYLLFTSFKTDDLKHQKT